MGSFVVAPDRPDRAEVVALLQVHLAFAESHSVPKEVPAPFGGYWVTDASVCMTLELGDDEALWQEN